jgi:hypothetical protein
MRQAAVLDKIAPQQLIAALAASAEALDTESEALNDRCRHPASSQSDDISPDVSISALLCRSDKFVHLMCVCHPTHCLFTCASVEYPTHILQHHHASHAGFALVTSVSRHFSSST